MQSCLGNLPTHWAIRHVVCKSSILSWCRLNTYWNSKFQTYKTTNVPTKGWLMLWPFCAEKNLLTSNAAHSVKLTEIPGKRGSNPSMVPGKLIYLPNVVLLCFRIPMKFQSKMEKLAFLLLENSLLSFCCIDFNQCLPTSSLVYTENNKRATMAIPKTHRNNFRWCLIFLNILSLVFAAPA